MGPGVEKLFEGCDERLDVDEVAVKLKVSVSTVRRKLRSGEWPGYCLGDGERAPWMIVKSELIAALTIRWNQS